MRELRELRELREQNNDSKVWLPCAVPTTNFCQFGFLTCRARSDSDMGMEPRVRTARSRIPVLAKIGLSSALGIIDRRGKKRAIVAYANKLTRLAFRTLASGNGHEFLYFLVRVTA